MCIRFTVASKPGRKQVAQSSPNSSCLYNPDDALLTRTRRNQPEGVMKILLAVDDSTYSTEATGAVGARPWPPNTAVRVLSVVEPVSLPASEMWYDTNGMLER